jgi:hypothetical protein
MTPAKLIEAYLRLRTKMKEVEEKHKAELMPFVSLKVEIETALLAHLNEAGTDSTKCKAGTAYKSTVSSVVVRDWPATLDFIKSREEWDLLEARVGKTYTLDLMGQRGEPIPGVEVSQATVLRVRST